jgi:hypothetical protein
MNRPMPSPRPACDQTDAAGVVTAEAGYVILDGLPGLAATLTPEVAVRMGERLIEAAHEARRQRR